MTLREGPEPARRFRSVVLWGTILLCAAPLSCSRRGGKNPFKSSHSETLVEGKGVGDLRIDETTIDRAVATSGATREPRAVGDRGVMELWAPRFHLSFVPPADGQGRPTLYAVRVPLQEDAYLGKTSKGIGLLDSREAMLEAYGPPDAEWVQTGDTLHYYQQGVVFATASPRDLPANLYGQARAALGKSPSEKPEARLVTSIVVVRPFRVLEAASTSMAGQQVISGPPKTDLLVSPY